MRTARSMSGGDDDALTAMFAATALLWLLLSATCYATIINFNISVGSNGASEDATSDPIVGTSLNPGDSFVLDIHALPNHYWGLQTTVGVSGLGGFFVKDQATRIANVNTTLYLDGVQVRQAVTPGTQVCCGYIGTPFGEGLSPLTLLAFTAFDQVVVDYTL